MLEDDDGVDGGRSGPMLGYKTYKRRWAMLLVFSLASACNAILWITFSPIASLTHEFYNVSESWVNGLSIVFLAAYVPASLASNVIFHRYGDRVGLSVGAVLNVFSALVRFLSTLSNGSFEVLFLGQTMGAIAQPFFTNMPAKVAATWFPADERDLATVIGALLNPVGIGVGSVLPMFFTTDDAVNMRLLLLVQLVIVLVVSSLFLAIYRAKPPLPPSSSQANPTLLGNKEQLEILLRDRNFIILLVCFGSGLGFFNALTTLVEQLVEKAGYTADDASLFSGLLLGAGIIAALVVGYFLDKTHKYKTFLKTTCAIAFCAILALVLNIRPDNHAGLAIAFAACGATMLPLLPIAFETAVECTYPVSEDVSGGLLMSMGQLTGIAFIIAIKALLEIQPHFDNTYVFQPTYILITIGAFLFCAGIQFFQGQYKRLQAEQLMEQQQQQHNEFS